MQQVNPINHPPSLTSPQQTPKSNPASIPNPQPNIKMKETLKSRAE